MLRQILFHEHNSQSGKTEDKEALTQIAQTFAVVFFLYILIEAMWSDMYLACLQYQQVKIKHSKVSEYVDYVFTYRLGSGCGTWINKLGLIWDVIVGNRLVLVQS